MLHEVAIALSIKQLFSSEGAPFVKPPPSGIDDGDGAMWSVSRASRFTLAENLIDEVVTSDHADGGQLETSNPGDHLVVITNTQSKSKGTVQTICSNYSEKRPPICQGDRCRFSMTSLTLSICDILPASPLRDERNEMRERGLDTVRRHDSCGSRRRRRHMFCTYEVTKLGKGGREGRPRTKLGRP